MAPGLWGRRALRAPRPPTVDGVSRGSYDPERARRCVRELAAVTDAELVDEIRAAADLVFERAEAWRAGQGWPHTEVDRPAYAVAATARNALATLPADTPLQAVIAAVSPMLGQWWPHRPAEAAALHQAIEALRGAAMHRPGLVRDSRRLTSHSDWWPQEP
jgi:hypothetical protein